MNLRALFISITTCICAVEAASIDHDTVEPFPQPEPVTVSEKAAMKFKPSLQVDSGCRPFPAVNAAGHTSAGLKGTGSSSGDCDWAYQGSQVYGRADLYGDVGAIMYAWYFPKDKPTSLFRKGHRHGWSNVVVWVSYPAEENSTVVGVSTASYDLTYSKYTPPPLEVFQGTTPMIIYETDLETRGFHRVDMTEETDGGFQDLIMWEQLTDEARTALNDVGFGKKAQVPFNDANFETNIDNAWPY